MSATIREISQATGLSIRTVSRVLRMPDDAPHKARTRELVLKAANELGYRPNTAARAARTGRFNAIAMLLGRRQEQSYLRSGLLDGVYDVLERHDLHLTIARVHDESLTDESYVPKMLREWMADGMLINYVYDFPPKMVELIERYGIPSIWINANRDRDCVYSDNRTASQEATRRLLERGHRRIAYLDLDHPLGTDLASKHFAVANRWIGYSETMHDAGLTPVHMGRSEADGRARWAEVLAAQFASEDRPTALVAAMDGDAAAALLGSAMAGLRIPRDLSMITFAGGLFCASGFEVDSMFLDRSTMGREAACMLMEKIEDPQKKLPSRMTSFRYLAGHSLAAPVNSSDHY